MHKKIILFITSLTLCLAFLAGCSLGNRQEETSKVPEQITQTAPESKSNNTTSSATSETSEIPRPGDAPIWGMNSETATTWVIDDTRWVQIIVPITNFSDQPLKLNPSSISLKDTETKKETVLKEVYGYPRVIFPEETGYYFVLTAISSDYSSALDATLSPDIIELKNADDYRYFETKNTVIEQGDDGIGRVSGTVINSLSEQTEIEGAVVFYDTNGAVLTISPYYFDSSFAPNETKDFKVETIDVKYEDIDSFQIYAYAVDGE